MVILTGTIPAAPAFLRTALYCRKIFPPGYMNLPMRLRETVRRPMRSWRRFVPICWVTAIPPQLRFWRKDVILLTVSFLTPNPDTVPPLPLPWRCWGAAGASPPAMWRDLPQIKHAAWRIRKSIWAVPVRTHGRKPIWNLWAGFPLTPPPDTLQTRHPPGRRNPKKILLSPRLQAPKTAVPIWRQRITEAPPLSGIPRQKSLFIKAFC